MNSTPCKYGQEIDFQFPYPLSYATVNKTLVLDLNNIWYCLHVPIVFKVKGFHLLLYNSWTVTVLLACFYLLCYVLLVVFLCFAHGSNDRTISFTSLRYVGMSVSRCICMFVWLKLVCLYICLQVNIVSVNPWLLKLGKDDVLANFRTKVLLFSWRCLTLNVFSILLQVHSAN